MPTSLTEFLTGQRDQRKADLAAANVKAAAARAKIAAARAACDTAQADYVKLAADIAVIRQQLAAIAMPADGEVLVQQLRTKIVALRAKQKEALDDDHTLSQQQFAADRADADVAWLTSRLADDEVALADAKRRTAARTAATTALGVEPLKSLPAKATAALAAKPYTDAEARLKAIVVNADLHNQILARAQHEAEVLNPALASQTDAATKLDAARATSLGDAAGIARDRNTLERADAPLRDYVANGAASFQAALAQLAQVADTAHAGPQVSKAQQDEMNEVAVVAAAADAEKKEKDRDDKRDAVATAQKSLDDAIAAAKKAGDGDAGAAANVKAAQAALDKATTDLSAAQTAYDAAKDKVDAWEARVPDTVWHFFDDFADAKGTLARLAATDPAALGTAIDAAETALVATLTAAAKNERMRRDLESAAATRAYTVAFLRTTARRRVFAALRGD